MSGWGRWVWPRLAHSWTLQIEQKHHDDFSFLTNFQTTFSWVISRSHIGRKTSLIIHLAPHGFPELVTICLSLKELLRKSLTRTLLGMGRSVVNLSGRQELHLLPSGYTWGRVPCPCLSPLSPRRARASSSVNSGPVNWKSSPSF